MSDLGRIFFFDTSVLGSGDEDWQVLLEYSNDGRIALRQASALEDDLAHDDNPVRAAELRSEASSPEAIGLFVLGESRLGSAFLASGDEAAVYEGLFRLVFPGTDPGSESRTASNKRRDAMHLFTVRKYGGDGLITRDGALLRKADALMTLFGVRVFSPKEARVFVDRLAARSDVRNAEGFPEPP